MDHGWGRLPLCIIDICRYSLVYMFALAALNVDCHFDMLSYLKWDYVRKALCLWLVSRIGLVWRIGSSYSKLKNWWGVNSTKTIQNRSLDKKSVDHWFVRSVTVQRLRHSSKGLTWSNLESFGDWNFRLGYSHRMILVRWEAERCFPGSNLVAESHGKDGVEDVAQAIGRLWCDVMICNASDGLQVGKHHIFVCISGTSITFCYSFSFRSNLGWLANYCRLKTQVLELQTFMSFQTDIYCFVGSLPDMVLAQHVQLDPDIAF